MFVHVQVAHHIVDLIGFRPSLGLRRVCKTTQYWVDTHPNPLKEQKLIVLDTTEKLIQFNNEVRTLPLKHFQLGPFNSNKYPWPELQTFPNPLVQGMRTLHLKVLNCCESKVETDFMEQFTSLSHLTIGLLEKSQKDSDAVTLSKELSNVSLLSPSLPRKGLINLTRLSFGRVNSTLYFMDLIRSCPNLQHIDLPSLLILPVNIDAPTLFYNVYEKSLMEYVCDSSTKSLREINFNCSNPLRFTGNNNNNNRAFEERFILALHDKHVKLSNIPMSTVYSVFKAHESRMFEIFKQLVVSVVGVWPSSHSAPCFPNVENFIYDTSSGLPSNGNLSYAAFKNELYPKVNTITAKVYDPRNYAEYEYYNRVNLLLFDKEKRPDIEHLDLQIRTTAIPGFYGDPNTHRRNQIILVPADICFNKFPNLKTLRLTQTQIFTQNPRHYSGLFRALGFCTAIHTLHISTPSALTSHAVNGIHNWGDPTSIPSFQLMRSKTKLQVLF